METKNNDNAMVRQVVLDTETTGMNQFGAPHIGHCIIEIGAVEMINRRYTGRKLHLYIKPDRPIDPEAIRVHGITDEMVADKPSFADIAQEFIDFIQGAELLIHNAPFDVGFMDYEFQKHNIPVKTADICQITDTLVLARRQFPGKRNNLDVLCERLGIDNSKRVLHGALLDAEILGDVYLAMTGGQRSLFSDEEELNEAKPQIAQTITTTITTNTNVVQLITLKASDEENKAHEEYMALIKKKSKDDSIWVKRLLSDEETSMVH